MSDVVTIYVKVGKAPAGLVTGFGGRYMTVDGAVYAPKALIGGQLEDIPTGTVPPDATLVFQNVPPIGKLVPVIVTQMIGLVVKEREFTVSDPAIKAALYEIDFTTTVIVGHPHSGQACPVCQGAGITWGG